MYVYELRQVIATPDECGGYYWDSSYHLSSFSVENYANIKRAFLRALHLHGVKCVPGKCRVDNIDGGDILELVERSTGRPLYAAIFEKEV